MWPPGGFSTGEHGLLAYLDVPSMLGTFPNLVPFSSGQSRPHGAALWASGALKHGGGEPGTKSCLGLEGALGIYLENGIPHVSLYLENCCIKQKRGTSLVVRG